MILFRKPVSTPDQVRGRLFRDHALVQIAGGLAGATAELLRARLVERTLDQVRGRAVPKLPREIQGSLEKGDHGSTGLLLL